MNKPTSHPQMKKPFWQRLIDYLEPLMSTSRTTIYYNNQRVDKLPPEAQKEMDAAFKTMDRAFEHMGKMFKDMPKFF